ncbi:MAG: hypothetical protein ABSC56_04265 [Solirubrobacteraceae bacterium]|jgi:hypothetical protein
MGKYLFAYRGGAMAEGEAAQQEAMAAWGAWFGKLGGAVTDPGAPLGASRAVGSNGPVSSGLSGYTVVTADNLDAAVALTDGCPLFAAGGSVDVYEAVEM